MIKAMVLRDGVLSKPGAFVYFTLPGRRPGRTSFVRIDRDRKGCVTAYASECKDGRFSDYREATVAEVVDGLWTDILLVNVSGDDACIFEARGDGWSEFFQTDYREISAPEFAAEFDIGRIFEDIKNYCHDKSVHHS